VSWKLAKSGGKGYTIQISGKTHVVRRNDGFTWSTGTRLGQATSLADAIEIIKADSGSKAVDMRDA